MTLMPPCGRERPSTGSLEGEGERESVNERGRETCEIKIIAIYRSFGSADCDCDWGWWWWSRGAERVTLNYATRVDNVVVSDRTTAIIPPPCVNREMLLPLSGAS